MTTPDPQITGVNLENVTARNITIKDVTITTGTRPPKPPLAPAAFLNPNTRPLPRGHTPGALLNARYEVVPFYDPARQAELDALAAWCADPAATAARLFTGPGGSGKTRLLIEWCKRLRGQGWSAGFLPDHVTGKQIDALLNGDCPHPGGRRLRREPPQAA
jgi:hypothetical protein